MTGHPRDSNVSGFRDWLRDLRWADPMRRDRDPLIRSLTRLKMVLSWLLVAVGLVAVAALLNLLRGVL